MLNFDQIGLKTGYDLKAVTLLKALNPWVCCAFCILSFFSGLQHNNYILHQQQPHFNVCGKTASILILLLAFIKHAITTYNGIGSLLIYKSICHRFCDHIF